MPRKQSFSSTPSSWSRDVNPDTSVTYSRRSYYYDREFSDSIVRPTDFDQHLYQTTAGEYASPWLKFRPPRREYPAEQASRRFIRGRVLQSASGGGEDDDDDDQVYELQDRGPATVMQIHSPVQSSSATSAVVAGGARSDRTTRLASPEYESPFAGLDIQKVAQGIVAVTDLLVRFHETYQRIRDREEEKGKEKERESDDNGDDDNSNYWESAGVYLDPYYLEAGPPRQSRAGAPRRVLSAGKNAVIDSPPTASTSTSSAASVAPSIDPAQGHASDNDTTTAQASIPLPPLPARKRVCYYLIASVFLGVVASFGISLWWAQSRADVSAGFTAGGYIIAVNALLVAVVGMVHRPTCRCWAAGVVE
ncbi:hypothetical protein F4777DRAFT_532842 [Nemania sp. FL0916]|nr:hypothetical protein F4777DRAFT_532842 [Nemania sp. FL0916]